MIVKFDIKELPIYIYNYNIFITRHVLTECTSQRGYSNTGGI